jgi:trans-aconitate 3-methyltransferase
MVAEARRLTSDPKISIHQAGAENLPFLADQSVDMAAAGQAAHWFDYSQAWPELARLVKPGGTLAFWGYKDHVLVGYPQSSPIFWRYFYGEEDARPGTESLARFWEQPGQKILQNSLRVIEPPAAAWEDVRRIVWDPNRETADVSDALDEALWLRKIMKLGQLEMYIRTYSASNNWKAAHLDWKGKAEGGDGDVIDLLFEDVVAAVPEWRALGSNWRDIDVDVAWGTVILLARRRRLETGSGRICTP